MVANLSFPFLWEFDTVTFRVKSHGNSEFSGKGIIWERISLKDALIENENDRICITLFFVDINSLIMRCEHHHATTNRGKKSRGYPFRG